MLGRHGLDAFDPDLRRIATRAPARRDRSANPAADAPAGTADGAPVAASRGRVGD